MINNTLIFNEKSCTSSEESFLFNEKDTVLGAPLSDWEIGKTNILFVTGFSGSGKSTISREYSIKYKCNCIELDKIAWPALFKDEDLKNMDPIVYEFFTKNPLGKKYRHTPKNKDLRYEFIDYCMNNCDHKIIIDGIQILYYIYDEKNNKFNTSRFEKLRQYPLMFKGTSLIQSSIRATKRSMNETDSVYTSIGSSIDGERPNIPTIIGKFFEWYKLNSKLNARKDKLKNNLI